MKRILLFAASLSTIIAVAGCDTLGSLGSTFSGDTPTERANADMDLGEYTGLKHAIGVKGFENEAGWRGHWDLGDNLSAMLESALYDTGRFVMLEREKLQDVLDEQDLVTSGRAASAKKVAKTGFVRPARYLATGSITTVEDATSGSDGGIRIGGLNLGLGGKKSQVTIIAKLIDTTTGEIVAKERITGKPGGISARVGYSSGSFGANLGGFSETPLGEAAQDAINQAAEFFARQMEEFPFEGSVVKVASSGQVIINRGSQFGLEVGQELVMAEAGEVLLDPDTGAILDREQGKVIGTLKVERVREKVSYTDVIAGEKKPAPGTTVQIK